MRCVNIVDNDKERAVDTCRSIFTLLLLRSTSNTLGYLVQIVGLLPSNLLPLVTCFICVPCCLPHSYFLANFVCNYLSHVAFHITGHRYFVHTYSVIFAHISSSLVIYSTITLKHPIMRHRYVCS